MGTSTNQRSPNTPSWRLSRAVLGMANVGIARQSQELWKAAVGDRGESLRTALGAEVLARAADIADTASSPIEAVRQFDSAVSEQRQAGLFLDLGKRALARSVAARTGRRGFASELFSEAVSYYASRDLASVVGRPTRIQSVDQALSLKSGLRSIARRIAEESSLSSGSESWRVYVSQVLDRLTGGGAR